MKVVVVVQARMGSTRLPRKVLLPIAGRPVLECMLERVRAAHTVDETVIATSTLPADDAIDELGRRLDLRVTRGHPTDLLDRHVQAARESRAGIVVKVPSDCPLIDPAVVDRVLNEALSRHGAYDFFTNLCPPTWPDGNDVEALHFEVLEQAWREAELPHEREHTTPFVWSRPERFRVRNVRWETGLDYSASVRLTLDYPEDYRLIDAVYTELYETHGALFALSDILELLQKRPALSGLNRRYHGQSWRDAHPALRAPPETRVV